MKQAAAFLVALVGAAAAQSTTKIDVVVPFIGNSSFHASILDAKPAATTYILGCEADADEGGCTVTGGSWDGFTLVSGPTTVGVHHTYSQQDLSVGYEGSTSGKVINFKEILTESGKTVKDIVWQVPKSDYTVSVTVTAGVEKLAQQTREASTATTTTTTRTGPAASGSEPIQTGSSPTATSDTSASASTPTPTNAATRTGQVNVLAGLAGGAAAVLGAMVI